MGTCEKDKNAIIITLMATDLTIIDDNYLICNQPFCQLLLHQWMFPPPVTMLAGSFVARGAYRGVYTLFIVIQFVAVKVKHM